MDVTELKDGLRADVLAEIDHALGLVALRRSRARLAEVDQALAEIQAEVEELRPEAEQADQEREAANAAWLRAQFGGGQNAGAGATYQTWLDAKARAAELWAPARELWRQASPLEQEKRELERAITELEQADQAETNVLAEVLEELRA